MLIAVAAKDVLDTFYISRTRESVARAESGEQLISIVALLLLGVAAGLAVVRLPLTAAITAVSGVVFLGVVALPEVTAMTYLMVPAAALLISAAAAFDVLRQAR